MKKILAFGIAAVALAAFFISCSNDGGSSGAGDGESETSSFEVGKEISYDGGKYLVLKNDFSESSLSSSRAAEESYSGLFYQNKNAENVRREKIKNKFNISKYIELFLVTTKCEKSTAGQSSLNDCYLILNEKGKKMYRLRQVWQSTSMFSEIKGTAEKTAAFNKLTEGPVIEHWKILKLTFFVIRFLMQKADLILVNWNLTAMVVMDFTCAETEKSAAQQMILFTNAGCRSKT